MYLVKILPEEIMAAIKLAATLYLVSYGSDTNIVLKT